MTLSLICQKRDIMGLSTDNLSKNGWKLENIFLFLDAML